MLCSVQRSHCRGPVYRSRSQYHSSGEPLIAVRGIDTALESSVSEPGSATFVDLLVSLGESETGVILGAGLAGQIGVRSSTQVSLLSLGKLLRRRLDEEVPR